MDKKARMPRDYLRRLLFAVFFFGLFFIAGSWFFAFKLTDQRCRSVGSPPADFPFSVKEVSWTTGDGETIRGWFIPAEEKAPALILLHGFGGDRRSMLPRAKLLRQAGYSVLLYDARACGESTGNCITFGFREKDDLVAALDFLRQRVQGPIACLGVSQGGATILLAADKLQGIQCVICESAFDELTHAVDNRFRRYLKVPAWLGGCLLIPIAENRTGIRVDAVKPIDHVGKLACPVFIMGGENDMKTMPEETARLFQAARDPKQLWIIPGAGHRDFFQEPEYQDKILRFLAQYLN